MEPSSPNFMTCEQLKDEIAHCQNDINKRILIIDVRNRIYYDRCHLCLDTRHNISSIRTKIRVMNIDPDKLPVCTAKKMMDSLDDHDANVFKKRKDATDVIIVDAHTDDLTSLMNPKSKIVKVINGLTRFDNQIEDKIIVPIHILRGGFREWIAKYPHFTTNPQCDPESTIQTTSQIANNQQHLAKKHDPSPTLDSNQIQPPMKQPVQQPKQVPIQTPPQPTSIFLNNNIIKASDAGDLDNKVTSIPTKPVPIPPGRPPIEKPVNVFKNAPGTAIPVTPISSLRSVLPRSQSSPNVNQGDEDLEALLLDLDIGHRDELKQTRPVINQSVTVSPSAPPISDIINIPSKPRFDRTLKPAFNNESVNAIRAQLNFGRSPEASGKAITGLQNLGNTCFMNSVIQCLAYLPTLEDYFCSQAYLTHINFSSQFGSKGELAVELGSLIEKLNGHKHRYIEPKSFRESVVKHVGFAGNEQQDSHEFMMMLFEKLHHDLNVHEKESRLKKLNGVNEKNNNNVNNKDDNDINIPRATLAYQFWRKHLDTNKSIISELFEGITMSTLTCAYCRGQSNTFEVFNCLSLPIPSETRCHLRDCLSHFTNPERIDAAWECPRCKQKREADKKIVICKLPKVLIIHLKRFSLDGRWRQKLQTTVDFPLNDLSVDCTHVLPQSAYIPQNSSYNLVAVVNHMGHLDGGHYTAFCKLENQRWYTFDDSNVNEMKDSDVCGQAAYLLFYASAI